MKLLSTKDAIPPSRGRCSNTSLSHLDSVLSKLKTDESSSGSSGKITGYIYFSGNKKVSELLFMKGPSKSPWKVCITKNNAWISKLSCTKISLSFSTTDALVYFEGQSFQRRDLRSTASLSR